MYERINSTIAQFSNKEAYQQFMDAAAYLYKYSFYNQLLIYNQAPNAKAVASKSIWEKLGCKLSENAQGINILADDGQSKLLVYDVTAIENQEQAKALLWSWDKEDEDIISSALEPFVSQKQAFADMESTIIASVNELVGEYVMDHWQELCYQVENSLLEELDDANLRLDFLEKIGYYVNYEIFKRLNLSIDVYLDQEAGDIQPFNTVAALTALTHSVQVLSEQVLSAVAKEVRVTNRKDLTERGMQNEHQSNNQQIRTNEKNLLTRAETNAISNDVDREHTRESSNRNRNSSKPTTRVDHDSVTRKTTSTRQRSESNGMGTAHEYAASASRRNHHNGTDLQLESERIIYHLDTDKVHAIIKGTEFLQASHEDIQSFFLSHEDENEKIAYLKNIFNTGYTEFSLYMNIEISKYLSDIENDEVNPTKVERVGYKVDEEQVHFWEGNFSTRINEVYKKWEDVVQDIEGMILLDKLMDDSAKETAQFTLFGDEVIQEEPFIFKQKVIDAVLKNEHISQKRRIYDQLNKGERSKENIDYMKQIFGYSGRLPVVAGTSLAVQASPKGYEIWLMGTEKRILLKWHEVIRMISRLMQTNQYLTTQEKTEWNKEKAELVNQSNLAFSAITNGNEDNDDDAVDGTSHHRERFDYALTKPSLSDEEIQHLIKNTDFLKVTQKEMADFFQKATSDIEKEAYIKVAFNDELSEILIGDEKKRYGYKAYENGLRTWKDNYMSPSAESYCDWAEVVKYIDDMVDRNLFLDDIPIEQLAKQNSLFDVQEKDTSVPFKELFMASPKYVEKDIDILDLDDAIHYLLLCDDEDKANIRNIMNQENDDKQIQAYLERYIGYSESVELLTGELADIFVTETGITLEIESDNPNNSPTNEYFNWQQIINEVRFLVDNAEQDVNVEVIDVPPGNYQITDNNLGIGGVKTKFANNVSAIKALQQIENENRQATLDEQETLAKYVGWGGLSQAFDGANKQWSNEYDELRDLLPNKEYESARASTLNAFYTSPVVINAMYQAIEKMGFSHGNILEPAMGTGNFFGLLPESMQKSNLYGVELDHLTGRIAKQLYQNATIEITGFEKSSTQNNFFDVAIGNVPFGDYKVSDSIYDKHNFKIHDYFFAKTLDKVRTGGVIAFVTSKGTLDKKDASVRKYLAQRAELVGAIRLPNTAFQKNAGTEVTSDILFLKKREHMVDIEPDWVHLGLTENNIPVNNYFVENPEMLLGEMVYSPNMYGDKNGTACISHESADLEEQLHAAIQNITAQIDISHDMQLEEIGEEESILADPNVKNYSYAVKDDNLYYREDARMHKVELSDTGIKRTISLVELRDCVHKLMDDQLYGSSTLEINMQQQELNTLYDNFTQKYGLINSQGNKNAFSNDESYYLLCSLEILNENGTLKRKADMFTKRTIQHQKVITHVDNAQDALACSLNEKAKVDIDYMSELTGLTKEQLEQDLTGVIFRDFGEHNSPAFSSELFNIESFDFVLANEYLSGEVCQKLALIHLLNNQYPEHQSVFQTHITALEAVQPKLLTADEIDVRLGATWIDATVIEQFMHELFYTPRFLQSTIELKYEKYTAVWHIRNKSKNNENVKVHTTFGTARVNAYKILEETLNLRDIRIYDTVLDKKGNEKRQLNWKETTLALQKQVEIKEAFKSWVFDNPERRDQLVHQYNSLFNTTKARTYDGSHLAFPSMNPAYQLNPHQKNGVARILYGGNTLLAHVVGAGKTFTMASSAMESKRLGLSTKNLFVVPNHIIEQFSTEFLQLYPSANVLVATKKDFEKEHRKKFCARIATGDYDAIVIGHSQFEKIPISVERQERIFRNQIDEITNGIKELKSHNGEKFTIKQLEKTKRGLETKLNNLSKIERKDDVVTFEQLGIDKLFVDEAHNYKNLFLYTKMRNVAGVPQTAAQKSSDLFMKCQYLGEVTGGKGVVFATGTPISNSMTELYTMMRYLQYAKLEGKGLAHFDSWAATFGETITAMELAPEGTGYRMKTRFAKFFNLPELMNMFKEVADIQTADMLNLPTPKVKRETIVVEPTAIQQEMVQSLSKRASLVRSGSVHATVDNMLKITSDGRKIGLDQRLMNELLPDESISKVNACINNVFHIWKEAEENKSTQLIFSDLATPKDKGDIFSVYSDIKGKLMAKDIPEEEIAFIHDAKTDIQKKALFAKVRSGQVRILIGSTPKMGAGTNVQDKLIALHNLDCPWRPSDLEQRGGRIERQGNENEEVSIFNYVTEGTFDAYMYQTNEIKQKFISQIMTSHSPVRSCEDVDEVALSFAEIKALCTGDPNIKEKMELEVEVSKLRLLKADFNAQRKQLSSNIIFKYPEQIRELEKLMEAQKLDLDLANKSVDAEFSIELMGVKMYEKEQAGRTLLALSSETIGNNKPIVGKYRGFEIECEHDSFFQKLTIHLKNHATYKVALGNDAVGNITRMDNVIGNIHKRLIDSEQELANIQEQLVTAKKEVSSPFSREQEFKEKMARLEELNALVNEGEFNTDAKIQEVENEQDNSVLKQLKEKKEEVEFTLKKPNYSELVHEVSL